MTLKRKFMLTNLTMLILPVAIIGLATVLLLLLFFTTYIRHDLLMSPEDVGNSIILFLYTNPTAVKFLVGWTVFCIAVILITNYSITYRLSKHIITPLTQLEKSADKIRKGDLDFEILGSSYRELDSLCGAFNEMRLELKQSHEKESYMMKERSMLLAHLSHDLKTPITSVKGYAQGILDGVASEPEKQRQYLETILSKIKIIEELAGNLSEYSHLEASTSEFKFTVSDFSDFLREICMQYFADFEKNGISLEYEIPENPVLVKADFEKLYRVFSNIFDNSIKYKRADSNLTRVNVTVKDGGIYTVIEDDGIGIPADKTEKVFDDFYRVDSSRSQNIKGNGLGLGIAKQITEKHSGKIWLRSGENGGTTAVVYLPCVS